jgi:hypothetical protein
MPDDLPDEPRGPRMVIATRVMNPGPARVGKLAGGFSLPRTVELPTLIAAVVGGCVGLMLGAMFGGIQALLYGAAIFSALAVFVMTYSPLEGESMVRWLGLTALSRTQQMVFAGETVQVSIGVCPIDPVHDGPVRIVAGHVNVAAGQYDGRGVRISTKNRNLDAIGDTVMWVPGGGVAGRGGVAVTDGTRELGVPLPDAASFARDLDRPSLADMHAALTAGTFTGPPGDSPGMSYDQPVAPESGDYAAAHGAVAPPVFDPALFEPAAFEPAAFEPAAFETPAAPDDDSGVRRMRLGTGTGEVGRDRGRGQLPRG